MALRELLNSDLDVKMRVLEREKDAAGILTGMWNPLESIQNKPKPAYSASQAGQGFEPPPRQCNGLPRRASTLHS